MDYKTINKFVEVLDELVTATKEQTAEIKKFRTDLKLNNLSPNVKEEIRQESFVDSTPVGSTSETSWWQESYVVDWEDTSVDGWEQANDIETQWVSD